MERKSPGPGTGTSMAATDPAQAPKRYRPAPAKTFQCRGYGDCRMVFSRSEHLARHIRKHTGERPFACHCSKQFSRLDNLRQHAQTVHADKHDQNERMMRDLTSLHASMAAANKLSARTHRRPAPAPSPPAPAHDAPAPAPVKQEDPAPVPYELYPAWQNDMDNPKFFFAAPGSRPATSERLPPLSSIVQQQPAFPRTATAPRPPSSSAPFYPAKPFYHHPRYDPPSSEPSPFYFAPPDSRNSPPSNPRKRAFSGPDGPVHSYDDLAAYNASHNPAQLDYDYGSESRPQSRRLSVMELCNEASEFVDDGFIVNGERPSNHTPLAIGAMSISGPQRRTSPSSAGGRSDDGHGGNAHGRISPPSRRLTPHAIVNGDSYPPPRPHSTTFSVSSTTSNSPPVPAGYSASQPQTHFAYPPPPPPPQPQHPHPHPHAPYALVGAVPSLHHSQYTPSPAPTSATSYYSSRSSSFSPRSPAHVGAHGHGHGHLAHQQAQAYHALQQQGAAAYSHHHHHPHHTAYPPTYEYGQGYNS